MTRSEVAPLRTEWVHVDGTLRSPALERAGVVAGFTTRALGSMAGGVHPLDEQEANRAALARRLGFDAVVQVKQVHGATVVHATAPFDPWPAADAMWTERSGLLLGVAGADCVPILVADPAGPIGAAHAGWEGTTLRVAAALVDALVDAGARRDRLVAALGPSIGPCCYTVDAARAELIRRRLGGDATDGAVFDLWATNARQLAAAGVAAVEVAGICTRCGGSELWSHRARFERGPQGSGLAFIGRPL